MNRIHIVIISLTLTFVTTLFMLGILPAATIEHALRLADNNFMWMVFFIRVYLGVSLWLARLTVVMTIMSACVLFYWMVSTLCTFVFSFKKLNVNC